jgi:hypothetical protein
VTCGFHVSSVLVLSVFGYVPRILRGLILVMSNC